MPTVPEAVSGDWVADGAASPNRHSDSLRTAPQQLRADATRNAQASREMLVAYWRRFGAV